MTPKTSPILWCPPKNIHKFLPPKILEIQNLDPQIMVLAYVCKKTSEYIPWGLQVPS